MISLLLYYTIYLNGNSTVPKKQAEENYKNGVMTVVWVAVGIAVVLGIFYGILFSSF